MNKKETHSLFNSLVDLLFVLILTLVFCYFVYGGAGKESIWHFLKRNAFGVIFITVPSALLLIIVSYWEREK